MYFMLQEFFPFVAIAAFSTILVACNDDATSSTTTDTSTMSTNTDAMSDKMDNNMNETGVMVGGANMGRIKKYCRKCCELI